MALLWLYQLSILLFLQNTFRFLYFIIRIDKWKLYFFGYSKPGTFLSRLSYKDPYLQYKQSEV